CRSTSSTATCCGRSTRRRTAAMNRMGSMRWKKPPSRRLTALLAVVLVCLAGLRASPALAAPTVVTPGGRGAAPAAPTPAPPDPAAPAPPPNAPNNTSPTAGLGLESPMCRDADIDSAAKESCRLSGSIAHPYPTFNYGLDWNVDYKGWSIGNVIPAMFQ